jgi:hypothetical protein
MADDYHPVQMGAVKLGEDVASLVVRQQSIGDLGHRSVTETEQVRNEHFVVAIAEPACDAVPGGGRARYAVNE